MSVKSKYYFGANIVTVFVSNTLRNMILQTVLYEVALKGLHFPSIGRFARCSGMSGWIALKGHH